MDLNLRKEQFSRVYVRAVATVAGYTLYEPEVDDDSIDLGIAGRLAAGFPCPPRIELQLKCTSDNPSGKQVVYRLKRKNYNDLRLDDLVVPRILVVLLVPRDESDWFQQTEAEMCLRRCAYWISLRGRESATGDGKVTIRIPRENQFTVDGLHNLMRRAAHKEPL
jgi:Domain of unknown function (DUF4365)